MFITTVHHTHMWQNSPSITFLDEERGYIKRASKNVYQWVGIRNGKMSGPCEVFESNK